MKNFTYVILFTLFLFSNAISGQTCNGNTYSPPALPATCTYSYTASGWQDQFGNPIPKPTSDILASESICILADNAEDLLDGGGNPEVFGTFYVAPGVTFSGSIPEFDGATIIIEGTASFSNTPVFWYASIYIDTTGVLNTIGDFVIEQESYLYNAGDINVGGNVELGGGSLNYNYPDASFIAQGNFNVNSPFYNCGLLEVVTGTLTAGGDSSLYNLCTTYLHSDFDLKNNYTNDGVLIVDGNFNFSGYNLSNNDLIIANNIVITGSNLIGNNDTSTLIVRNNSELQSVTISGTTYSSSITGHYYFDVDDGGGFDTVCGICTEEITILPEVVIPSTPEDLKADCGVNIIYFLCTDTSGTDSDGDGVFDICDLDDDNDGIPDADELGTIISYDQQPCGGDTPLDFSAVPTLLSGTDLMQDAVYRFPNVSTGMDAIVTIVETNNATVAELDRNVTTPTSFKPRTGFNFTNAGERGYIEYKIQFVNSGGTTPQIIDKFFMNFNDLDGGASFGEQNWADNPKTYTIDNPTEVTMNTDGTWIVATGATSDYSSSTNEIPQINFAVNYTNKSEISIRVGAVARTAGVSSAGRSHSIEFNCVTNYVAPETYSLDADFDGIANHLDLDSDNDGILDADESGHGQAHTNGIVNAPYGTNGLADSVETSAGSDVINYALTDTNGIDGSNFLDLDSDSDSCYDALEGTAGYSFSDINILTGQLLLNIDANGVPGGISQGIGTSIDNTIKSDVCNTSGAMIDFDGVDDYVEQINSAINGLNEYTISFWFKYDGPVLGGSDEVFLMGQKGIFEIFLRQWGSGSNPALLSANAGIYQATSLRQASGRYFFRQNWSHFSVTVTRDPGTAITEYNVYSDGYQSGLRTVTNTVNTNTNPFRIGVINGASSTMNFTGSVDELKIFNKALTKDQIQRMVYQEIENNAGNVHGTIIDKDIVDESTNATIPWTDLISYFPMSNIKTGKVIDDSAAKNDATLHNITTMMTQTAPLPFETVADGAWTNVSTWLHGDIWNIEDMISYFGTSNQSPEPWSIVKVHHDVSTSLSHRSLGLFVDADKTLSVTGDNEINNSWYLELNGTLDLADDSQLIQGSNSDLVTSADGKILRRQEGNADIYWYNYWASPVGSTGATTLSDNNTASNNANNSAFNLDMIQDGNGNDLLFTSDFDDVGKISDRWLYSFLNGQDYYDWSTLTPASAIEPGVGYTQKGTGNDSNPDPFITEQQYTFVGKPNNGTILIPADDVDGDTATESEDGSRTTILVGNPYPSALDAEEFIRDNIDFDNGFANPIIQGTIRLWEQWAGDSHWLSEYQGGYGFITLTGTERAYQHQDIPIANPENPDNRGIKTPTKFIPVGQGFFVEVIADYGNIKFDNSQRIFKQEALGESVFLRGLAQDNDAEQETNRNAETTPDPMQIIRLEFAVSNGATRRFLLGFSDHTTDGLDHGYDGGLITEIPEEDMTSLMGDKRFVIQAFSPIVEDKVIDLSFNASGDHTYSLDIVEMKNIDPSQDIYLKDNLTGAYFNLRQGPYSFSAAAGEDNERFDIVFQEEETLSNEEILLEDILIFVKNNENTLFVKGLDQQVKTLSLTNMLGQTVKRFSDISNNTLNNGVHIGDLSSGVYLVNLITENDLKINKKIILE